MINLDDILDKANKVVDKLEDIPEDGDIDTLNKGIDEVLELANELHFEIDELRSELEEIKIKMENIIGSV